MFGVFRFVAIWLSVVGLIIAIGGLIGNQAGPEFNNLILAILTLNIGISLYYALRSRKWAIDRAEGMVLLVIIWTLLPVPIALSLVQSTGLSLIDGYFEATSALTTTGASVFSQFDNLPSSALYVRGLTQWLGGLLTLLGVVVILAPTGLGGLPTRQVALINRENSFTNDNLRRLFVMITSGYLALTVACFACLVATQVRPESAFLITLSTVSSGGIVSGDTPFSEIGNGLAPFVLIVFMTLAGTSILWQRLVLSWRVDYLVQHREAYYYFGVMLALGCAFTMTFFAKAGSSAVLSPLDAIREGFFTAASLVSTTGFEIRNSSFTVLPAAIVLAIVLVGGCTFSTAGGISFYRIGGMVSHAINDLNQLIYPNSVSRSQFGSQHYDTALIKGIWTYFFVLTVVMMVGTFFLATRLNDFEAALIASVAALSNIGGFYSTGWNETGQWVTFGQMDGASKATLSALMILGRLHVLALLAAFNRSYWLR